MEALEAMPLPFEASWAPRTRHAAVLLFLRALLVAVHGDERGEAAGIARRHADVGPPPPGGHWFPPRSLTPVETLLYPRAYVANHSGRCRKGRCALYVNARSIALEFGVLLLVATYAIGYALGDMRWVIGRIVAADPMEQAAEAEAAEAAEAAETAVLVVHDAGLQVQRQPPLVGPDAPVNA